MKKVFKKAAVLTLAAVLGIFILNALSYAQSGGGFFEGPPNTVSGVFDNKIDGINISGGSLDVEILPAASFRVEVITRRPGNILWAVENGILKIQQPESACRGIINRCKDDEVKIYFPSGHKYKYILADLSQGSGAGDIEIKGVAADYINLAALSGDIDIENSATSSLRTSTSSGDIDIENVSAEFIEVVTTSGDVELSGPLRGENHFETASGDVELKVFSPEGDFAKSINTRRGRIKLNGIRTAERNLVMESPSVDKINIKTISGDIKLSFLR